MYGINVTEIPNNEISQTKSSKAMSLLQAIL
jgi:hypothetical protein